MAQSTVPKGPGQAEVIGDLSNPQAPNQPGTYVDPVSGAEVTTLHPAGADAVVRMGFVLKENVNEKDK